MLRVLPQEPCTILYVKREHEQPQLYPSYHYHEQFIFFFQMTTSRVTDMRRFCGRHGSCERTWSIKVGGTNIRHAYQSEFVYTVRYMFFPFSFFLWVCGSKWRRSKKNWKHKHWQWGAPPPPSRFGNMPRQVVKWECCMYKMQRTREGKQNAKAIWYTGSHT